MELTKAATDVLAERRRQVDLEGWTPQHDDEHEGGEMATAAACYAANAGGFVWNGGWPGEVWPWPREWWKPSTARRDLVKAAALILSEIERLDRAEAAPGTPSWLCPNCQTPRLCQSIQGCDRDEIAR